MPDLAEGHGHLMYFFLFLLLALLTAAVIVLLHRDQRKKRADIVERTAPLAAPDLAFDDPLDVAVKPAAMGSPAAVPVADVPVFTAPHAEPGNGDNWQDQVRQLREKEQDTAALQLCRQYFPRIQAFQQAAVILRQLVRTRLDNNQDARQELHELYRIAVMADLYRSSNSLKPKDPLRTLHALQQLEFDYQRIGTRSLRLLTKSDVRHLEQLWGRAAAHCHAEEADGLDWAGLCK